MAIIDRQSAILRKVVRIREKVCIVQSTPSNVYQFCYQFKEGA